jgi:spermidine/putrescine transport system ATP-binding protein
LDEPLGALDTELKTQLQSDMRRLRDDLGVTMLYVTHDIQEAMGIADQIAVLHEGRLQQVGSPEEVYRRPTTDLVARLLGPGNLLGGELVASSPTRMVIETALGQLCAAPPVAAERGQAVTLMVRPEALVLGRDLFRGHRNRLTGTIREARFLGGWVRYSVELQSGVQWIADRREPGEGLAVGQVVQLSWEPADTWLIQRIGRESQDSKTAATTAGQQLVSLAN